MGRKGWAGAPPADDAEARKRIVDATLHLVDRHGVAGTTVSNVADALGITRRTVYRYFTGTEELFTAVVDIALEGFVADVKSITADLDIVGQLVEVVAYIIEALPQKPQLALLLANDRTNHFSRALLVNDVFDRCRTVLTRTHIDWDALGYDDRTLDELIEFLLRTIQSMVVAPLEPPRSSDQLRAYLHRWVGPALA